MTRFMITLEQGVELMWHAVDDMVGGEIYVKKISSMSITEIARAVAPLARYDVVGIRPGEKLHEQMIGPEDSLYTYEYDDHYKICRQSITGVKTLNVLTTENWWIPIFTYGSDNNTDWMSVDLLHTWIDRNRTKIGAI